MSRATKIFFIKTRSHTAVMDFFYGPVKPRWTVAREGVTTMRWWKMIFPMLPPMVLKSHSVGITFIKTGFMNVIMVFGVVIAITQGSAIIIFVITGLVLLLKMGRIIPSTIMFSIRTRKLSVYGQEWNSLRIGVMPGIVIQEAGII